MPDHSKPTERMVTVCDKCLQASCWHGIFMCDEARYAGTVEMPVSELLRLGHQSQPATAKTTVIDDAPQLDLVIKSTVLAERERIAAAIESEADLCPCDEDAKVLRETAALVRANFSYEEMERQENINAE